MAYSFCAISNAARLEILLKLQIVTVGKNSEPIGRCVVSGNVIMGSERKSIHDNATKLIERASAAKQVTNQKDLQ